MNLIVNINPYLLREYRVPRISINKEIIAGENRITMDKNTTNPIKIASIFNIDTRLITYLGGNNGKIYKDLYKQIDDNLLVYPIRDETVEQISIKDGIKEVKISTARPRITHEEIRGLYSLFMDSLKDTEYVMFTTVTSDDLSLEIYRNLLNLAYNNRVKTAVAASHENIDEIVKCKPYLLLIDRKALEKHTKINVENNWEISRACYGILENGVGEIVYLDGRGNISLYTKERNFRTIGDVKASKYMANNILASLICSKARDYDENTSLALALAASIVKLDDGEEVQDASEFKRLLNEIEVESFNVSR